MPKFLASIQMSGNSINLEGGALKEGTIDASVKIPHLEAVLFKLDEIALAINALKPKRVYKKRPVAKIIKKVKSKPKPKAKKPRARKATVK